MSCSRRYDPPGDPLGDDDDVEEEEEEEEREEDEEHAQKSSERLGPRWPGKKRGGERYPGQLDSWKMTMTVSLCSLSARPDVEIAGNVEEFPRQIAGCYSSRGTS